MKDMKIKKRLISGFLFVIVISVAIIIAALVQMNAQRANYNDILKYRKYAREEINRLEGKTVPAPETTEAETETVTEEV